MTAEPLSTLDADPAGEGAEDGGALAAPIDLDRALEALLILADEPVALVQLATATSTPVAAVREAVERLRADYDGDGEAGIRRAFELREVGGGWRIFARTEFDAVARDFIGTRQAPRLSQAALETLAVIAYRQPVTRQQVAAIRAVNVDSVVRTLVARGLIEEAGRDEATGATRYVTSNALLEQLGVNSLDELPKVSPLLEDGGDPGAWGDGVVR